MRRISLGADRQPEETWGGQDCPHSSGLWRAGRPHGTQQEVDIHSGIQADDGLTYVPMGKKWPSSTPPADERSGVELVLLGYQDLHVSFSGAQLGALADLFSGAVSRVDSDIIAGFVILEPQDGELCFKGENEPEDDGASVFILPEESMKIANALAGLEIES